MAALHLCGDRWADGKSANCDSTNHKKLDKNRKPFREGVKTRRRADRQAGTIGQDRGGYIHSD